MKNMTRQEYVAHLRRLVTFFSIHFLIMLHDEKIFNVLNFMCTNRKSSGFSRGASMYRGVTRSKQLAHSYMK